jgi:hypothetical protein
VISARADIGGVLRLFDRVKRRDQKRVFRDARKPVRVDLREHAKGQAGPRGRWPGLAASTLERKARGRHGARRLLGRLPNAVKMEHGPTFVRAKSAVRWARAHAEGLQVGRGARLRARRWMWISRNLRREVARMLRAAVMRAWRGR